MKCMKISLCIVFLFFCWPIFACGNGVRAKDTPRLIHHAISVIGQRYNEKEAKQKKFEILMSQKNNLLLLFKKFHNEDFWEVGLIYVKDKKIEVITYAIVKDFFKAKEECKSLIILLMKEFGNPLQIKSVKLDSSISESLLGYALIWEKEIQNNEKINVALKFGPLEENNGKFQLQISIYKLGILKNFIGIDQNTKRNSAENWEIIKRHYFSKND